VTYGKLVPGVIAVAALVACSGSGTHTTGPKKALFTYHSANDRTSYRSGQALVIHWVATSTTATSSSAALPVTLSASLTGPFGDVGAAKRFATVSTNVIRATALKISEYTGGSPVSRISIPPDANTGLYTLTTSVNDVGSVVTGVTTIHIVNK
jgi:hypothetical protein